MNELIDRYLNTYRQEIIDQTCKLIQIPSVRSGATEQYPYGTQCAQALDFCMRLARRKGLAVQNYDYYCVRADLSPATEGRQILFAAHADVVPPDRKGDFPPFGGVVRGDYIIGRGAVDDKGPLIALLYALAFYRQHNIRLRNRFSLLIGSDEESGMSDIDHYLSREKAPDLAIAADDDFPVVKGESGQIRFTVAGAVTPEILSWECLKQSQCLVPEQCMLAFQTEDGTRREVRFQKEEGNPLLLALEACRREGVYLFGPEQDQTIFRLIGSRCPFQLMEDFGEQVEVVPTDLHIRDGRAVLNLRLYFTEHMERVRQRLTQLLERSGLEAEVEYAGEGFQLPAGDMVVQMLTELYNRESGTHYAPYVMRRGMTYARKFPYACGFGAGNPVERKPFAPGYGTCHGPDEAHSIRTLIHAVRIYIKAIWKLDTWDWDVPERRIHHV